jgi:hypothetical protein
MKLHSSLTAFVVREFEKVVGKRREGLASSALSLSLFQLLCPPGETRMLRAHFEEFDPDYVNAPEVADANFGAALRDIAQTAGHSFHVPPPEQLAAKG